MGSAKNELVEMLNRALALEHAARIQYLAHAEQINGEESEKIIERLKEIAEDEEKHEKQFRSMIGDYLDGEPTMAMDVTVQAKNLKEILEVNLAKEKKGIETYKGVYQYLNNHKTEIPFEYENLEHSLRHIIIDEQEHVSELSRLLNVPMP